VSVSVSTHVLDTSTGRPAAGVKVELAQQRQVLASAETDADGRVNALARDLEPGEYELVFWPPSRFFQKVELAVALEEGHYHIPLLVSPYGCASYRGS
jgi:5-hydroxyisourate hydrolase